MYGNRLSIFHESRRYGLAVLVGLIALPGVATALQHVRGTLAQSSVAADGTVYGIQASGSVWRFNGRSWDSIPGTLSLVAVAKAGDVWGLQATGSVWRGNGQGQWQNVPGEQI